MKKELETLREAISQAWILAELISNENGEAAFELEEIKSNLDVCEDKIEELIEKIK